jgi:hypothetical protein
LGFVFLNITYGDSIFHRPLILTESEPGTFVNTAIRQPEIAYESIMDTENKFRVSGPSQVSVDQDAVLKIGIAKVGIYQGSTSQVGIPHTNVGQINIDPTRLNQTSGSEISFSQIDINQLALHHEGTAKVSFTQVGSQNSDAAQGSSHQINATQVNILQNSSQTNASKISFSSSITLQQFLSSHHFNLQNTTIPTNPECLTGATPFNLTIPIAAYNQDRTT